MKQEKVIRKGSPDPIDEGFGFPNLFSASLARFFGKLDPTLRAVFGALHLDAHFRARMEPNLFKTKDHEPIGDESVTITCDESVGNFLGKVVDALRNEDANFFKDVARALDRIKETDALWANIYDPAHAADPLGMKMINAWHGAFQRANDQHLLKGIWRCPLFLEWKQVLWPLLDEKTQANYSDPVLKREAAKLHLHFHEE